MAVHPSAAVIAVTAVIAVIAAVAEAERAVSPRLVDDLNKSVAVLNAEPLGGKASVAPTRGQVGEHASLGTVLTLDPEHRSGSRTMQIGVVQGELARWPHTLDEVGGCVAFDEAGVAKRGREEVAVGGDATDVKPLECKRQHRSRFGTSRCICNYFGEHGVEADADHGALLDA